MVHEKSLSTKNQLLSFEKIGSTLIKNINLEKSILEMIKAVIKVHGRPTKN